MIVIREASSADRDSILALRGRAFPGEDPEKSDPRFWEWEYRGGRMFVADDDGRVVAHLGLVAQPWVIGGEHVPGLLAVDAMTDPQYRGRGLFAQVATYARKSIEGQVTFSGAWQIRKAVLGGIVSAGWQKATHARVLLRPALLSTFDRGGGAPMTDVEAMAAIAGAMFDAGHVDRSAQWLRWRYFDNPLWHYDVTATANAWLVTRRTVLKGISTLAIVDVAWRHGASREASSLLVAALRNGRTSLAAALVTRAHPAYFWFLRHAFVPGPHRFNFLVTAPLSTRWQLTWGDTDHL